MHQTQRFQFGIWSETQKPECLSHVPGGRGHTRFREPSPEGVGGCGRKIEDWNHASHWQTFVCPLGPFVHPKTHFPGYPSNCLHDPISLSPCAKGHMSTLELHRVLGYHCPVIFPMHTNTFVPPFLILLIYQQFISANLQRMYGNFPPLLYGGIAM